MTSRRAAPRPRTDRAAVLLVAIATIAAVAVRLWVLRDATEIVVTDEVGYVADARWLATGYPDLVLPGTVYSPGYALLLAPLAEVLRDPATLHRAGVVLNALLVAAVLPLVYALTRRLLDAPPPAAAVAALVAGAYPALTLQPATLWAESLLIPLVAVWLLALTLAVTRGSRLALVVFAVTGVALYATHSRMVGAVPVTLLALALCARRRLLPGRAIAVAAVAGLLALVGTRLLLGAIADDLYVYGSVAEGRFLDDILATGARLWAASTLGQLWYLVAATLGTVVAGAAALLGLLRDRDRGVVALTAVLGAALFAAVSVAQMASGLAAMPADAPRVRADYLTYGRYNEAWAVAVVGLGVAWLLTRGPARVAAAGVAALAALGAGAAGLRLGFPDDWLAAGINSANVLGLVGWLQDAGGLDVERVTLRTGLLTGALALAAVLAAALRGTPRAPSLPTRLPDGPTPPPARAGLRRPAGLVLSAVAPLVVGAVFVQQARDGLTGWLDASVAYAAPRHVVADTVAREGLTGLVRVQDDATGPPLYLLQYWAPRIRATVSVDDPRDPDDVRPPPDPDARYYLSVGADPRPPAGSALVEVERLSPVALWVLPGQEQERLRTAGRLAPLGVVRPAAAVADVRVRGGRVPSVTVRHTGSGESWRAAGGGLDLDSAVRLSVTWTGCTGQPFAVVRPADLPRVVPPGEAVALDLPVPADLTGCRGVQVTVGQRGGPPFRVAGQVGAPVDLP